MVSKWIVVRDEMLFDGYHGALEVLVDGSTNCVPQHFGRLRQGQTIYLKWSASSTPNHNSIVAKATISDFKLVDGIHKAQTEVQKISNKLIPTHRIWQVHANKTHFVVVTTTQAQSFKHLIPPERISWGQTWIEGDKYAWL